MDHTMLEQLARICGIETEYYDIWGNLHKVSAETQIELLAGMGGIRLENDNDLQAALAGYERDAWLRPVPPVLVVPENVPEIRIPVSVPASLVHREVHWTLNEESGGRHSGIIRPGELPVEESREVDGNIYERRLFTLIPRPGPGYHRFELNSARNGRDRSAAMRLVVTPVLCYRPEALASGKRVWGPAVQLYALRSRRNWGMGDFTDLKVLVEWCAESGADVIGLNPLHALFLHNPDHASPYSPSSRFFLNPLYLDVEAVPEFAECAEVRHMVRAPEFQEYLRELRDSDLVEYGSVAAVKLRVLEALYAWFRRHGLEANDERGRDFRSFQAEGGHALHMFTLFQALQEHFHKEDPRVWGWPAWPDPYRDPSSERVREFAELHRERIEFYQYLQWEAGRQYAAAARHCLELGLGIGLYQDMPLSVDRGGAEAWADQLLYAHGVSIGSPPDDSNLNGQDWGLPPMVPDRLVDAAYEPFIATLRHNMYHAGAIRIDHVMGLMRLFWIPSGRSAHDGAYVHYRFEDLFGILALESWRNRCLVVGEDLGTVPDTVREAMRSCGVLSYRIFYYEKDSRQNYKAASQYPVDALVTVSTHDMPPLAGFWTGRDLAVRAALGLFPTEEQRESQVVARGRDRAAILAALEREKLLPDGMSMDPASVPKMVPELMRAIHLFVARAPTKVMMVQLEDILGQTEQVNLPGTIYEHPNWRRKLSVDIEDLRNDPRLRELGEGLRRERGEK